MRVDIERQPGPGFFGLNGEGIPIDQVFVEVPKLAATGHGNVASAQRVL